MGFFGVKLGTGDAVSIARFQTSLVLTTKEFAIASYIFKQLINAIFRQVTRLSEIVGSKIAGKASGLSATAGVANVGIMKEAQNRNILF